jgi:hypothetical protein
MENYIVVLFKNKIRKRIIKKFITFKKAKLFYDRLITESDSVIFDVQFENGKESNFELGIVELSKNKLLPIYLTDEMGRSIRVKLDEDNMTLSQISQYKKEELLYDVQTKKKITTQEIIKKYLKGDGLKMISVLNNKIVLQIEEEVLLFSLKSESESSRFVDCLSLHFFKTKRGDCLFVKDYSSAQRKYMYNLLESKGIDKKILYRKFTTFPRSK